MNRHFYYGIFLHKTTSSHNGFSFELFKCLKFSKRWVLERKRKRALALEVEGRLCVVFFLLSVQECAMLVEGTM